MNRRQFLRGSAGLAAAATLPLRRAHGAGPSRLLVLWNAGGWDPSFVFDPHFESDSFARDEASSQASSGGITYANAATRPSVRSYFERYGGRTAVLNGLSVGSISHEGCTRLVLCGARKEGEPDVATRIAASLGSALPLPHLVLSGPRYPGSLGGAQVPLSAALADALADGTTAAEARAQTFLATAATGGGDQRAAYAAALDKLPGLMSALGSLSVPEDPTPDRLIELGLAALQANLCCAATLDLGKPNQTTWDSHYNNNEHQDRAFEYAFDRLLTVVDALSEATADGGGSLLDETLVLMLSEMGRCPAYNAADGKDHWPYTSALLVGAGVSGGAVLGATDTALVGQPINLSTGARDDAGERVTTAHLLAGVLERFGLDPEDAFPGVTPFSAPFADG